MLCFTYVFFSVYRNNGVFTISWDKKLGPVSLYDWKFNLLFSPNLKIWRFLYRKEFKLKNLKVLGYTIHSKIVKRNTKKYAVFPKVQPLHLENEKKDRFITINLT